MQAPLCSTRKWQATARHYCWSQVRLSAETANSSGFLLARPVCIVLSYSGSMGGAIAARVSDRIGATGLILVDIVEGTARAAYSHIKGIIESRPASFMSISNAIAWRYACRVCAFISQPKQARSVCPAICYATQRVHASPYRRNWSRKSLPTLASGGVHRSLLRIRTGTAGMWA